MAETWEEFCGRWIQGVLDRTQWLEEKEVRKEMQRACPFLPFQPKLVKLWQSEVNRHLLNRRVRAPELNMWEVPDLPEEDEDE